MKFEIIDGGLSVKDDAQAIDELAERMIALSKIINLFNVSDWQPVEVARWLQYEKDLALLESELYKREQQ